MGRIKANRVKRERRPRDAWEKMLIGEITPQLFRGRVITPAVITEMRATDPGSNQQLDAGWEREVLENNRPWIEDPELRAATEKRWAEEGTTSRVAVNNRGCSCAC
ncbi:hypothetical protein [Streptomyces sp. TS71-3]|uniref:hypothetical protein n=1 Tax=Streptomyces sp. TS71-3 TaxID=2733862 RepID=UPI001BB36521|nr:hypothetical protein [Streptomyces sp. TS71-3]